MKIGDILHGARGLCGLIKGGRFTGMEIIYEFFAEGTTLLQRPGRGEDGLSGGCGLKRGESEIRPPRRLYGGPAKGSGKLVCKKNWKQFHKERSLHNAGKGGKGAWGRAFPYIPGQYGRVVCISKITIIKYLKGRKNLHIFNYNIILRDEWGAIRRRSEKDLCP
ncbi:MAG TPA: hypothetical protein PKI90_04365 [bacterium]|nr:hypothetical protein [bacterium]